MIFSYLKTALLKGIQLVLKIQGLERKHDWKATYE